MGVIFVPGVGGAYIPEWNEFPPDTSLWDRLRAIEQRCLSTGFHRLPTRLLVRKHKPIPVLSYMPFFVAVFVKGTGLLVPRARHKVVTEALHAQLQRKLLSRRPCYLLQQVRATV